MQYISKSKQPPGKWSDWFSIVTDEGSRVSYDYKADYHAISDQIRFAREHLIEEQNGLCAYCQKAISVINSSIEHLIPKEHNLGLSTNYFNLIAVCANSIKDPESGRRHCDKERGSKLLPEVIFYQNATVKKNANHAYFQANADGSIVPKPSLSEQIKQQVVAFIEILNLNHPILIQDRRKTFLTGLLNAQKNIPPQQKQAYWEVQFERIFQDNTHPFRQFLLIFLSKQLGRN